MQKEATHPQVVTHGDTLAGSHLELPLQKSQKFYSLFSLSLKVRGRYLSGHDFSICTRDVHSCVEASLVVGLDDVAAVNFVGSHTAVVWALEVKRRSG